jgi:hypothetical protein
LIFGDRDLFDLWRYLLGIICTVYAIIVTGRSLWGWYLYFSAPDRVTTLMKRYTVVQLLRLRLGRFAWEFTRIGFWSLLLVFLLWRHRP